MFLDKKNLYFKPKKIKIFLFWFFNLYKKLYYPVECEEVRKIDSENSLIGDTYCFSKIRKSCFKLKSPIDGIVSQIYEDYTVKLINSEGLQILVSFEIKKDLKRPQPTNKITECLLRSGQKIKAREDMFNLFIPKQIKQVSIRIIWQPELVRKIDEESNIIEYWNKIFARIYYRNPYKKWI
jgi:hypothetical protein